MEAEVSVISALLTTPELFLDITAVLSAEDFAIVAHQDIYRAAVQCDATGQPVDAITVADALKRVKRLNKVGGQKALDAFVNNTSEVINILAHANIVLDKSKLRRLLAAGKNIATAATSPDAVATVVLESAEEQIFELGRERTHSSMLEMAQAVPQMLDSLAKARACSLVGHSSGIEGLDKLTGGFQGGQLIILAARPAMGKSALGVQIARHIAETTGTYVPLLSYEMSVTEITTRMLATATGYDLLKLKSGSIPENMSHNMAQAAQKMAELTMLIDDNPPSTIGGVRSAMRRLARRGEVGAIVIDYLQLMSGENKFYSENRNQEVSEISRGLKRLATELNVPIIALSQLNRQLEQRQEKRPGLSDLRESGSLEQDANAVLFLFREHVYNTTVPADRAELIVAKQRNGPLGTIHLSFNGACAKFTENINRGAAAPPGTLNSPSKMQSRNNLGFQ
jgi:replicative DNA helicase